MCENGEQQWKLVLVCRKEKMRKEEFMEFKKNQEIELIIDDLGNNGEGIGHVDGYALFVKEALPGERIRAKVMKCKKNYGFARLVEILPEDAVSGEDSKEAVGGNLGRSAGGDAVVEKGDVSCVGRVTPRCSVARQCGGCTLQHLCYEKQLAFKEKKVWDCLERIGGIDMNQVEWQPILGMGAVASDGACGEGSSCQREAVVSDGGAGVGSSCRREAIVSDGGAGEGSTEGPWHYRNKAQFPVRMQEDENGTLRPFVGFYAERSHRVIPMTDCAIQDKSMKPILEVVLAWMEKENITGYDEVKHHGLVRHIYIRRGYHTGEIMVCLVINGKGLPERASRTLIETLTTIPGMTSISLNINREKTNVILGKQMIWLWGKEYIEDSIGDIRYLISPQSFYQVNPVQTEKLYRTALEFADLSGDEVVWDLYCGIGTISLFLAKKAKKVYGVEIVPEAIENAKENARLNGIENVEFSCGAAEEVVPQLVCEKVAGASALDGKTTMADVVVVDPPRKGCDGVLLDTIEKMSPKRIVYVSCDSGTLARDVKVLGEKGYKVDKVRTCDMFPQGGHVETVCLLSRKAPV